MEKEKLNDLSILERMDTTRAVKYSKGFKNKKKRAESKINKKYVNSFEIKGFIEEKTSTNMLIPALLDAIGNSFVKIGIGVSSLIASIGYFIEKIKN
ncbi:MAG: hypothetical protein GXO22_07325 [Aquificae bacterium]|nr:hypothetical protein [Aquificota bacterium]